MNRNAADFGPRRHPSHGVKIVDENPTIVFLTVCTKSRSKWLACDRVHEQLVAVWRRADAWLVGRYMLMPDHLHLFAGFTGSHITLDDWVTYWKSQFSKGNPFKHHERWETDHWDTRVRTSRQYEEKWLYVRNNAFRHGLVQSADDWPYQGEVYLLEW